MGIRRNAVRHMMFKVGHVVTRVISLTGAVVFLTFSVSLRAAEQLDAPRLMEKLEHRLTEINSRSASRMNVQVTRETFPKASEGQISKIIAEQQQQVAVKFKNDPSLKDRLAATEFNVRNKVGNHVVEGYDLTVTQKGSKWRLDHNINKFEESVTLPPDLATNEHAKRFDLSLNRSRTYAWDGTSHRVLFSTDDPQTRNMQLYATDRNASLANQVLELGAVPKVLWESIKKAEVQSQITTQTDDSVTLVLTKEGTPWKATIVASPTQGYSLTRIDLDAGKGMRYHAEYGDYKLIDGKWYPATVMDEWTRITDGKDQPVRRQVWKVTSAGFNEQIAEEDAVFSFPAPHNASVQDYRGSQPFAFRTDEGLGVTEEQLGAMISLIAPRATKPSTMPAPHQETPNASSPIQDESKHGQTHSTQSATLAARSSMAYMVFTVIGVVLVLAAVATLIAARSRHE